MLALVLNVYDFGVQVAAQAESPEELQELLFEATYFARKHVDKLRGEHADGSSRGSAANAVPADQATTAAPPMAAATGDAAADAPSPLGSDADAGPATLPISGN